MRRGIFTGWLALVALSCATTAQAQPAPMAQAQLAPTAQAQPAPMAQPRLGPTRAPSAWVGLPTRALPTDPPRGGGTVPAARGSEGGAAQVRPSVGSDSRVVTSVLFSSIGAAAGAYAGATAGIALTDSWGGFYFFLPASVIGAAWGASIGSGESAPVGAALLGALGGLLVSGAAARGGDAGAIWLSYALTTGTITGLIAATR